MAKRMNRRQFFHTGFASAAFMGAGIANMSYTPALNKNIDRVPLGSTGLVVPRIAMGTGSIGGRRESNQTRLGIRSFVRLARHAWERGMKFFDMADTYGSHTYVREVLSEVPREDTVLLSKIWTTDLSWLKTEPVEKTLDRFRLETGSDYFDIVLLHCLMNGNWKDEKKEFIESLSKAKQQGIVKKVGVSCHSRDALKVAAEDPWVDVILARINPFGTHMDGSPGDIMNILEAARKNGKGVIGMKIFGNGDNTTVEERQRSLSYAVSSPNVHCMTLGLESVAQVDDAVNRVVQMV
ncbi:MAG: aldo/keto reductase [Bacteroidales bacterium]